MAQSVFVTRTAFWQLPGMLLIPGSENSFFYLHSGPPIIEMAGGGGGDVPDDVTNGVESSVTTIPPCCNFILTQLILQLPFDGLFKHFHVLKNRNFSPAQMVGGT